MQRFRTILTIAVCALCATALGASWSVDRDHEWCDDDYSRRGDCEVRELRADRFGGALDVDAGPNGGISVVGTSGGGMRILAKVRTWKSVDAGDVTLEVDGGRVRSDGPGGGNWAVSFKIEVPRRTDVELRSVNGGISLRELDGQMRFTTKNGGIALRNVAGDVKGSSMNGGITVSLEDGAWYGEGLDVETKNGGVSLSIPEGFSADLQVGTVNGNIHTDFPVTVKGRITNRLDVRLGGGGAPLRLMTTNGGVRIEEN